MFSDLAKALAQLPLDLRLRFSRPPTGNSLIDTFVRVRADDRTSSIEGVIVRGDHDKGGAWDLCAPFTVFTTGEKLIVCQEGHNVEVQ